MPQSLFVSNGYRATLRKLSASLLMLSVNLTGGLGALFLTTEVAYAAPVSIFSDGFESSPNQYSPWTSHDSKWTNSNTQHTGTKATKANGDTNGVHNLLKSVSTLGKDSITLSYWYRAEDLDSAVLTAGHFDSHHHWVEDSWSGHDYIVNVEYTTNGTVWNNLFTISNSNDDGAYHQKTHSLPPSAANNPDFGIRFSANLDAGNDTVLIDDVSIDGSVINYPLSAHVVGAGSVQSTPTGNICGLTTCTASYGYGTLVSLLPTASTGSTFTGWTGCDSVSGNLCRVTMSAAKSVTATFTLNNYVLTVTKTGLGSGTVTSAPTGINCGAACARSYDYGTSVTLTAIAASGSTFTGWSGAGCSGTGTCMTTMVAASTITANFAIQL